MKISFMIPLPPKGQARPRSRAVTTKDGRTFAQTYKDAKQRVEEDKLLALIYEHRPPQPLEGPLTLTIQAFMPLPQSKSRTWQYRALQRYERPTTKPDCDNIAKHLLDVFSGVFMVDDKQVVGLAVSKYYGIPARYEVELSQIGDGE